MSDYMPVEVVLKILSKLPVKSVVKCKSICKSWNTFICDPSFISAHLHASLSSNTPFLLIGSAKQGRETLSLHHDNDGFDKLKQLPFPPFGNVAEFPVVGSCNSLICVQLDYYGYDLDFVLWNPSIQKYISLPQANISEVEYFNVGFGFDSRTNGYKLLILGVDKDGSWIEPYLFSLNENCWRKVTAIPPNYAFGPQSSLSFVSGAVYWVGRYASTPRVLRFRKNGEVLLEVGDGKMTSLELNNQQMGASLYLNCELMEFHGVELGADILSLNSYVKSLVLLDKAVDVSSESDVNHPIGSSESDESIGGD
ncbi:hypothetical protein V6N12_042182 [Hibiscus sabdariffa]|uniref:F-box domain-containing protein n=1 Tax=Hibiscus sabdariffa TaxID=183260 RepID=A0ABR2EE16_9ROSI